MKPHTRATIDQANLTARQRYVLEHWLDGHSTYTIATALDITEPTARGHLNRALAKIKPLIRKDRAA